MNNIRHSVESAPAALIVDDSPVARRALGALLSQLGFRIYTAGSAEAALERLEEKVPDIVFMDHLLPEADGLWAVRQIRANPLTQRVPVVMYTSMETRQFAQAARAAGADDVIFKSGAGATLEVVLARLGLAPDGAHSPAANDVPSNLPAALHAALRRHREEMREELLAEFAIMERHEDNIRKELFSRVDAMTRQTVRAVEEQFRERRMQVALVEESRKRTSWAVAACLAVLFGASAWVNVGLWKQVQALDARTAPQETLTRPASVSAEQDRPGVQAREEQVADRIPPTLAAAVQTNWASASPLD